MEHEANGALSKVYTNWVQTSIMDTLVVSKFIA